MSGSKMPVKKHIRRAFWHAGAELSCFPRAVNGSSKIDLIVQMNPNGFQWLSADRKISGPARLKPAPTVMLWCPSRHGRPCSDRNLRPCTEVVNFTSEVTHLDEVSVSWMGTWENTGLSRFRLNGKHGKHGKPWTRFELTMFFQFFFFFGNPFHSQILVNSRLACSSASHFENFMTFLYGALRDASWCFRMGCQSARGFQGMDITLISFDQFWFDSDSGIRKISGGEDAREAWSPCWPSHARPKTMKTKSVCQICQRSCERCGRYWEQKQKCFRVARDCNCQDSQHLRT
jgi:hypothetical protein